MKWILLWVVVLALGLGCSWAITSEGAYANFGQSSIKTCGTGEGQDENCTVIEGSSISAQGANLVGGVISAAARMMGAAASPPPPAPVTAPPAAPVVLAPRGDGP